ncbi:uroporphyrinogen-III synthase [Hippea maritima]|uniref:Uroporphyrinogen III synthase HEM4 n=1 Tax=Hippea maritima (strain ATCC 700847 / DSM 10411 / MH2) TaxID=760142 RepID=F2LWE7_HIPMA|nr:uroporphyrinogen-III synthase [Hippea maritima]AEA32993.1 Uroporphyrinogen III synthase HEM4 [Hippea maritima DSM 10411]
MRIGVDRHLSLRFFPNIDVKVGFENNLDKRFLLKCKNIDQDQYDLFLTHDVEGCDISINSKIRPFYKGRVLFSANKEDLIGYTQLYDEVFEIHPVVSMDFRGIDFIMDNSSKWVVFTSKRAVEFFFKRINPRCLCNKSIAAIGEKTALALKDKGFQLDYVPEEYYSSSLIEFLKDKEDVLVITALKYNKAYDELKNVKVLPVYENYIPDEIKYFKPEGEFDFGLFSSPSAFWHIKEAFGSYDFAKRIKRIIAIGKTTKSYINSCGFEAETPNKATIGEMFKYIFGE